MSKKQITDKYSYENYTKKHVVVSKKGLIIGSICAGVIALGAGGAAIYLGVTRGVKDNSISFAEANEFAKQNYKFSIEDVEQNHKADIKNATISWDFSNTKDINDTTEGKAGYVFKNVFWNMIQQVLEDKSTVSTIKSENNKVDSNFYVYHSYSEGIPEIFNFIYSYTIYGIGELGYVVPFYSEDYFDLKKNGDNITYTTKVRFTDSITNNVTCTLNKNGTVKELYMPVYGEITSGLNPPIFDGHMSVKFTY